MRDHGGDSPKAPKSHGVGLSIVRELARANGGGFTLSQAHPGFCAHATLKMERFMKILIAEDDPNLRAGLTDLLALEGLDCIVAEDGEAAWTAFVEQAPALCLFDVMMPRLDGLALCRRIRERDHATPILLLSAKGAEIDRVVGLEIGADDYIAKPFSARELVARIKAALRRVKAPAPATPEKVFRMGDLAIDPDALRATRGAGGIDLAPRELAVLQALYARKGKAVSRDELVRSRLGARLHAQQPRARPVCVVAAQKDRAGPGEAEDHPDGAWGGVSLRRVQRLSTPAELEPRRA